MASVWISEFFKSLGLEMSNFWKLFCVVYGLKMGRLRLDVFVGQTFGLNSLVSGERSGALIKSKNFQGFSTDFHKCLHFQADDRSSFKAG